MYCKNCGNKNSEGSRFCPSCGEPVDAGANTMNAGASIPNTPNPYVATPPKKKPFKPLFVVIPVGVLLLSSVFFASLVLAGVINFGKTPPTYSSRDSEREESTDRASRNERGGNASRVNRSERVENALVGTWQNYYGDTLEYIGYAPDISFDEYSLFTNENYQMTAVYEIIGTDQLRVTDETTDREYMFTWAVYGSELMLTDKDGYSFTWINAALAATPMPTDAPPIAEATPPPVYAGVQTIRLMAFNDEVPSMVRRYRELNPDFASRYEVDITMVYTDNGAYTLALDNALLSGNAPDMYCLDAAFVTRYTQGDMSQYAGTLESIGIRDLRNRISSAQIAPYAVQVGTRNNQVVALPYQSTASVLIYRRSIARAVFGSDDPATVRNATGPGWDRFMDAAGRVSAAGYSMISGEEDLWAMIRSTGGAWVVNGSLNIHPDRMAFFDYARTLSDNGYTNYSTQWTDGWYADMNDYGNRPVFCFMGPAWLINYVMAYNGGNTYGDWAICELPVGATWGGTWVAPSVYCRPEVADGVRELIEWITLDTTNNGAQYMFANGTLLPSDYGSTIDAVTSSVVMARANGRSDFLGGQNMFDVFVNANDTAQAAITQYDEVSYYEGISRFFFDAAMSYARGDMSRADAEAWFRNQVADYFGIW